MPRVLGGRYFSCARSADGPDLVVADERGEVSSRVLYMALTVLYKAMTVLYIVMTVLYMAMTVLHMALTVLYVAGPTCPAGVSGTGAAEGGWREWGEAERRECAGRHALAGDGCTRRDTTVIHHH